MASRERVYKRIANAIRAKDSLSLNQLEKMLKQLPSCIFLKDTEGKYVFSTQIWHHLDTGARPTWRSARTRTTPTRPCTRSRRVEEARIGCTRNSDLSLREKPGFN